MALDAGNTNVTVAVFRGSRILRRRRFPTDPAAGAGVLARRLRGLRCGAAIIGSVVPALDAELEKALRSLGVRKVFKLSHRCRLGIRLRVAKPGQVGADRIANALAAFRLYGGPAVVMDLGTATTFDCVGGCGDYLGGAILPGPHLAARALAEHTAMLPLVDVRKPRRVIGRHTVECIQAGIYFGYLGMLEKVLKLTLAEMRGAGHGPGIRVLATGGLASLFAGNLTAGTTMVADLTLQGLRLAYGILSGRKEFSTC